ncbi:MAG: 23S rRNA (guanosine(2251)-2'-O)-methyltransferase RlmB [Oscillospiraceae bacterium]|nr:23S rRNA (guanosine(2251)-2'-O)-methyltransferase RlmB [Oscillospiraceae bacterium]
MNNYKNNGRPNKKGGHRESGKNSRYRDDRREYGGRNNFRDSSDRFNDDYDDNRRKRFDDEDDDNGLIIGRNPVIEALKAGKQIDTLYVNSEAGGSIGMISRLAKDKGVVVKQVSDAKLTAMARGASHQGCIASGACAEYVSVEDILNVSKSKGTDPFIIICDEIEDPHNLGAIIRTAEAAGADGIIIPKRRSASLNSTVNKTSAGAASWVPVARVPNLGAAIDELKKNGVWIFGTDASGDNYTDTSFTGAIGLVIGSEGFGMGRLIREKCDHLVKLPMFGKITSLNASVAAGIFMYEAVRQRCGR